MDSKKAWVQVKIRKGKRRGIIYLSRASTLSVLFTFLSGFCLVGALILAGVPIVPLVWYRVQPGTVQALEGILKRPVVSFGTTLEKTGEKTPWQPPLDTTLPAQNRVLIPVIGVDTGIVEKPEEAYEEALKVGVWRVPDFGTPFKRDRPVILVAHRFGYLAWSNSYRHFNSFYNLPKLKPGDKVLVNWEQRQYVYEIYGGEESSEMHDYTADLILYTCEYLESDIRIFRYARLIQR